MNSSDQQPVVMCIAELDPSGGGGLAADIETVAALGCHCTPVISAIAVQDTQSIKDTAVIDGILLLEQMRAVLEDIDVGVIKVHQLATTSQLESVHTVLMDYAQLPVIFDPALSPLQDDGDYCDALRSLLLPRASLVVLTEQEAFTLAPGSDSLLACVHQLAEFGSGDLLINDHPGQGKIRSQLFRSSSLVKSYDWDTLPQHFLGAGSTFGAAIAASLAHGLSVDSAIRQAQEFTWTALNNARRLGMGKLVPDRQINRRR